MQLISKFKKGLRFLLCVIYIYSKCTWVVPLKNKKGRKPNKIWVYKGSEFCNRQMKSWLQDNDIEMYSTHNGGKSVVVERFIRALKNKIYKYMYSVSQNVYINKLPDIVDK